MIGHYELAKINIPVRSGFILWIGQDISRASRPEDSEGGRFIGSGGESSGEGDSPGKGGDTRDARGDTGGEGDSSKDRDDSIEGDDVGLC